MRLNHTQGWRFGVFWQDDGSPGSAAGTDTAGPGGTATGVAAVGGIGAPATQGGGPSTTSFGGDQGGGGSVGGTSGGVTSSVSVNAPGPATGSAGSAAGPGVTGGPAGGGGGTPGGAPGGGGTAAGPSSATGGGGGTAAGGSGISSFLSQLFGGPAQGAEGAAPGGSPALNPSIISVINKAIQGIQGQGGTTTVSQTPPTAKTTNRLSPGMADLAKAALASNFGQTIGAAGEFGFDPGGREFAPTLGGNVAGPNALDPSMGYPAATPTIGRGGTPQGTPGFYGAPTPTKMALRQALTAPEAPVTTPPPATPNLGAPRGLENTPAPAPDVTNTPPSMGYPAQTPTIGPRGQPQATPAPAGFTALAPPDQQASSSVTSPAVGWLGPGFSRMMQDVLGIPPATLAQLAALAMSGG